MIDKAKLIEWLKSDSVTVVSADVAPMAVGQMVTQAVTLTIVNADVAHILEGVNVPEPEAPLTEGQQRAKDEAEKKVREGWED